jgi:hypothetical protein
MPAKTKRKLERPGQSDVGTGKPRRPLAPRNVTVMKIDNVDERSALADRHKKTGMHMFYGDRSKTKDYLAMGYEPVVEDGEQVNHKGDPLFSIAETTFQERRMREELESVNILEQARMGARSEDSVRDSSGETHRVQVEKSID